MINLCHFKPEFTGKHEEDAETHLLRTNSWMRTHTFDEDVKVQRFCLTLLGKARLWYETLTPITNVGQPFNMLLDDSIQNKAIPQNNTSISGEVFILVRIWTV